MGQQSEKILQTVPAVFQLQWKAAIPANKILYSVAVW